MNSHRLLATVPATVLAVLTGAAALVALPLSTGVANAAPAVCATTYTAPGMKELTPRVPSVGYSVGVIDFQVPDNRTVLDVDYGFEVSFAGDSSALGFVLNNPQTVEKTPQSLASGMTGPLAGAFVMDDEATVPFTAVSPPSGRYRPSQAASSLDGNSAQGQWRLMVTNIADGAGSWGNATLTLTVACDADGDGAADATDNCPTVPNHQANHDDDSLGDACDLDMDGDNIVNTDDGCPLISASTATGCPAAARTATLRSAKRGKRLKFTVRSSTPGCVSRAEVTLWRARRGKDLEVLTATTSTRGRYRTKTPRQRGNYYFLVAPSYAPGQAECSPATSPSRKVRR